MSVAKGRIFLSANSVRVLPSFPTWHKYFFSSNCREIGAFYVLALTSQAVLVERHVSPENVLFAKLVKSHLIMLMYLLHKANGSEMKFSLGATIYLNFSRKKSRTMRLWKICRIRNTTNAPFISQFYLFLQPSTKDSLFKPQFVLNATMPSSGMLSASILNVTGSLENVGYCTSRVLKQPAVKVSNQAIINCC